MGRVLTSVVGNGLEGDALKDFNQAYDFYESNGRNGGVAGFLVNAIKDGVSTCNVCI